MNKAKKNVVIVGFTIEERRALSYPMIENGKVKFCNSISDAIKYQGYMLILDNKANTSLIELDKKYKIDLKKNIVEFDPTLFGLDFYMNCTGYKVYPLEAYLAAKKYWLEKKEQE